MVNSLNSNNKKAPAKAGAFDNRSKEGDQSQSFAQYLPMSGPPNL